jgi:hypothetical protein
MTPEQFAYWLHGWSEINGGMPPNSGQWVIINDHLNLIFNKITPTRYPAPSGIPPYVTGSLDMSWYPESLREHNRLHPDNILCC